MSVRRVITMTRSDAKADVQQDAPAVRQVDLKSAPGFSACLLWSTSTTPEIGKGKVADPTPHVTWVPSLGETRLMMVTFPPDAIMRRPEFDPAAFGAEFGAGMPGFADAFERQSPGMHCTSTVDYDVVLEGDITLELDDGRELELHQHDVVIQNGTRHAWRNRSDKPATLLFVLVGALRTNLTVSG